LLIDTPAGFITQTVNRAEADIDGLEIEAKWIVTDRLLLSATATLIDWRFKDHSSLIHSTPTEEYTLRANYLIPAAYGQWMFDLNWAYRGDYPGNCAGGRSCIANFPAATADSSSILGGRIGVDIDSLGLNVALWGRNLTNEEYGYMGQVVYSPPTATVSNITMGTPRTFGMEVTYNF
jgi:iron complex outermembrane receptor protein